MSNVSTAAAKNPASLSKTKGMTQVALFSALIILMAFTPFLGYIPLGFTRATIIHIPVIIGALVLGPKKGAVLGFLFGLCSFVSNTFTPTALSFAFSPLIPAPGTDNGSLWALVVCFIPRILVGILPWFVFQLLRLPFKKENMKLRTIQLVITGAVGAFINTFFVMGLIYVVFRDAYAAMKGVTADAVLGLILGVVATNGVPEAIAAAVLVGAVCLPMQKLMKRDPLKTGIKNEK